MRKYTRGIIKILTSVPTTIDPIMATASGRCSWLPMSSVKSIGTIARIVVSDVMIIGRRRRVPAVWLRAKAVRGCGAR